MISPPRLALAAGLLTGLALLAAPAAAQSDREPRLPIAWNRYYDYDGIVDLCRRLAESRPELCRLEFIGDSVEGRPLPLLVVANAATGAEADKPAMWVDGNVHGNEVQGGEAAVYLVWTLLERYDDLPDIRELVDTTVFHVLPMVNPDGRQHWFADPNTPHSSRTGRAPLDNDGDGLFDEDDSDDLDGDGELLTMRKRVAPGTGDHRLDPVDPRIMVRVDADERVLLGADYVMLGGEGIDNDGDGQVNEDGAGGYDMNRNWPGGWMPPYIQFGAGDYPFSFPETAAIGRYLMDRPNIAAVQSFHNSGGMILRGPGSSTRRDRYPAADLRVYDSIGKDGEKIIPFYKYLIIHEDLYDVHGGFVTWTAEILGILSFTNELWANTQYYGGETGGGRGAANAERLFFDDNLMFGETWVDWHEVEHPDYGTVEIGGFRKMTGRTAPTFMIEEMLHRNAAFCIFHAKQMPKLELVELRVDELAGGARVITCEVRNTAQIPTRTALAGSRGIGRPDIVSLSGEGLTVVAGGTGAERFDLTAFDAVEHEPERLRVDGGIPGHGSVRLRWVVTGSGPFTVTWDAEKAADLVVSGSL